MGPKVKGSTTLRSDGHGRPGALNGATAATTAITVAATAGLTVVLVALVALLLATMGLLHLGRNKGPAQGSNPGPAQVLNQIPNQGPNQAAAQAGNGLAPALPAGAPAPLPPGLDVIRVQVEHTLFHPMDGVTLQVERMDGRMIGKPGQVISLDDRNSFSVQLDHAVTRLSAHDLSALINSYLLRRADSAIRHVDVSFDGQSIVLRGKAHKLITLPFVARGVISATPRGELRMHLAEFKVGGLVSRGFLAFFGLRLDDVAQPQHQASFRVEGDDIITSLNQLFPPPLVSGLLTRVHVEGQDLVQTIGIEATREHPILSIPRALPEPANYIYFSGGQLQFGRVTMNPVDMKLVDSMPENAFDFSLDHYQEQIEAGYVKVLPTRGLIVYAGDWGDLAAHRHK